MNYKALIVLMVSLCFLHNPSKAQKVAAKGSKIILEVEFPKGYKDHPLQLESGHLDFYVNISWKPIIAEVRDHFSKWTVPSNEPLIVNLTPLFRKGIWLNLFEPGDSIHIVLKNDEPVYSGKGAAKFSLLQELGKRQRSITPPSNPSYGETNSLGDYLEWSAYLDKKLENIDSVFERSKTAISPFAHEYLKAEEIAAIDNYRLRKFGKLVFIAPEQGLSGERLGQVFDATMFSKASVWLRSYTGKIVNNLYTYDFIRKSVQRKYNFNLEHDSLEGAKRKIVYADLAKKIYNENTLQGFMMFLLTEQGLKEHTLKDGITPEIEMLLNEFYAMPGYPEYKAYVKGYEQMIREWVISVGGNAPDFSLENPDGNLISKKDLKGNLVLLIFFDNSEKSTEMITALKNLEQVFYQNPEVIFLNISTEEDKAVWKKSLSDQKGSKSNSINLYTNGQGKNHPILKYYNVKDYPEFHSSAFPRVFLLDHQGKFLYHGEFSRDHGGPLKRNAFKVLPDPGNDNGLALINDIYKQLALMNDGPYVFHDKTGITAYNIHSSKITEQQFSVKNRVQLIAHTDDLRKTFPVQLKNKLTLEPSVTAIRPDKLFVLSDIEGNFDVFRKLLQSNKIIDPDFNWTFGKGHLVFAGDMFDRGAQVTECLWLVYILEEKSKAAGGYVHFILGNHEIMNLQGDHRYVEDKYKQSAALVGKTLTQLYNEDTELGKWLRTKNIVEKIGDLLFTHGGISAEMKKLALPVAEINKLARPYYANRQDDYKDAKINTIMSSKVGPFWYRGYYAFDKNQPSEKSIDSIMHNFDVKHIITGHTIVADTISTHYHNKLINTDTKHAEGKSEALLIEGANFYRVNGEGKRVLLFKEKD